ncbi:MAG: FtsX-like permease family protein, partial [Acidobacteria bacterium]|nr:FtsX-like permease family protein [Acidobacteriota bacterium]
HYTSTYWPILSFVVKAQGDPAEYGTAIRALIHQVDPAQVVESVEPLQEELSQTVSSQRLQTVTLGTISALAVLLAGIGLYGLLSSHVTLRTREFGIRLALGALPRQILWTALKPGLVLTLAGAALGLIAALTGGRVLESLLFDTPSTDLAAILGAASVLNLVALAVALFPARRGARVDPAGSLRHE